MKKCLNWTLNLVRQIGIVELASVKPFQRVSVFAQHPNLITAFYPSDDGLFDDSVPHETATWKQYWNWALTSGNLITGGLHYRSIQPSRSANRQFGVGSCWISPNT
ncbi:MAG: hypothetical protein GY768_14595 [Planctomycetaceae bacterium]|nr:hypothetical protein [Planctomycetaceae bacterium]